MKICVLDGFTLNPGDLSWEAIEQFGEVTVYDRTAPDMVVERSRGAEILLTNKTVITDADMAKLPDLKFIGVLATGYNIVDIEAANRRGIIVTNIPAYSTMSVAQQIFGLLLTITNHSERYAKEVRGGKWTECQDFSYTNGPITELADKRFGIVGYGNIGHAVAGIASAFGMQPCVVSSKPADAIPEVTKMNLEELFSKCDIVCMCCPLTNDNKGVVNASLLSLMKPSAIFINTGRGGLVNEADLAAALRNDTIHAAGLDVLSTEPPKADNPLVGIENCYITPHIAWASTEARQRLMAMTAANIEAFLSGTPVNVVNSPK